MMGDGAVPFATRQEFRNQTIPGSRQEFRNQNVPWRSNPFPHGAGRSLPPRITDMTGEGVVELEEEMEAISRTLYAMIEIGDEMRPQQDL